MKKKISGKPTTRRAFIKTAAVVSAGLSFAPSIVTGRIGVSRPVTRPLGRIGFDATTLGLGGQASIQWTPEDVDPVAIILKAHASGINYFDTSNAYGPSQRNFGTAFRELGLVPGLPGYSEARRRAIFLTSKTGLRLAKGTPEDWKMRGFSNGPKDQNSAVDDVRRTLTQVFGDGNGFYPKGAYLDMVLIHHLANRDQIDTLHLGLDEPSPNLETIGALAGLRDLRDGTNLTGLNPGEEKLIRHIGFSGHTSPSVMMEMIRRDRFDLLDGMLIAINANDRLYANFQYNTIPVAAAKNMGIIGMKVFSDGTMYGKGGHFSKEPSHVVRTVGSESLPSRPLVEYTLSVPAIATAIIGIGQISEDPKACQLGQNLSAAQLHSGILSESDRRAVEQVTRYVANGETNYFQDPDQGLTPATNVRTAAEGEGRVRIEWDTATAGDEPIVEYAVWRNDLRIGTVPHKPQVTEVPFSLVDTGAGSRKGSYRIVSVDRVGREASVVV